MREYCVAVFLSNQTSAQRVIAAINSWMHGQNAMLGGMGAGYADSDRAREAEGLVTTFTALILRDAAAHILHLGDGVAARVNASGLERLTEAHRVPAGGGVHLLARRRLGERKLGCKGPQRDNEGNLLCCRGDGSPCENPDRHA